MDVDMKNHIAVNASHIQFNHQEPLSTMLYLADGSTTVQGQSIGMLYPTHR